MDENKREKTVLLVEDNPGDVRLIEEIIKAIQNYNIKLKIAEDLVSGFNLLKKYSFDIILLDLTLPDSNGLNTVLSMLESAPNIPLIILTGFDDQDLAIEAVKAGAEDYLVKGHVDSHILKRVINYGIERYRIKKDLKDSESQLREALIRTNFYKDLFTHDMNNMLQNILSAVELGSRFLTKPDTIPLAQDVINQSKIQIHRAARLILNIRKLSQLEELEMHYYPVEVQKLLQHSIKVIKESFSNQIININIDTSESDLDILANNSLEEVFQNLLYNAVQHNENEIVQIKIKIQSEIIENKKYLKMEFQDNGVGIEDDWKKTIFLGYKQDKSLCRIGLGLSLVKKIIEDYGGRIWVQDRIDGDYSKGSNFILLIPEAV